MEIDIFRMFCFYCAMALYFSKGDQVRAPLWTNYWLIGWCMAVFGFGFFLIFQQNTVIGCMMRFNCDSQTTLNMKDNWFVTIMAPLLTFRVGGECVYGPQI